MFPRTILVSALLASLSLVSAQQPVPASDGKGPAKIQALVVSGANNHDWRWTSPEIERVLEETGMFDVEITYEPGKDLASPGKLDNIDVLVLDYNGPRWGDSAEQAFLKAVRDGTGVAVIHAANNAFPGWQEYEELVGLCWRKGTGHGRYHAFDVHVVDPTHPITKGMDDIRMHPDELYHRLLHTPGSEFRVLMSAYSEPKTGGTGRHEPMVTAAQFGKGRVFHTPLGHTWSNNVPSRASWTDPQLRRLVARGTEWAATGEVTLDPRPVNWLDEKERKEGFELLFNGRNLDGWRGYRQDGPPKQGWSVRDAAIVHTAGGGGGDLMTDEQFGDFDFRFSWKVAEGANSGIIWRVLETEDRSYMTGPEYQVLDDMTKNPDKKHAAGALYDLVGSGDSPVRPAGTWNEGRIVIKDGRVQHWLNGKQLLDVPCEGPEWEKMVANSKFRSWPFGRAKKGHLVLQDHGDEVAYRDLRIRKL
ncbi:MAG: family 16 glycoside hydrolase [Planctomycetota bacterium]|nr:family 16 glycoside hydrolase [Planctomycetota bacterium]